MEGLAEMRASRWEIKKDSLPPDVHAYFDMLYDTQEKCEFRLCDDYDDQRILSRNETAMRLYVTTRDDRRASSCFGVSAMRLPAAAPTTFVAWEAALAAKPASAEHGDHVMA